SSRLPIRSSACTGTCTRRTGSSPGTGWRSSTWTRCASESPPPTSAASSPCSATSASQAGSPTPARSGAPRRSSPATRGGDRFPRHERSTGMPPRRCWPSRRHAPCGRSVPRPWHVSIGCWTTPGGSSRRMPMPEPAVLFYCQHVLGMGHLVRSLALARALADRFRVVFLNGGAVPRGLPRPAGVEFVDLPPLGFDATGRLVSRDSSRSVKRAQRERREAILRTFRRLQPRAIVVELFPFGRKKFAEELLPLFEEARALGVHRPLLVSSLRDILTTGRRDQARHDERACMLANRHLDAIMVHADPRF